VVVPGYLSAVLIASPWSAATIAVEAFITYFVARGIGVGLARLGLWTVFFGRDRFFLLIAVSVIVRLASEGYLLPALVARYPFAHASDLYSIGLVVVPLLANALWNAGFVRGVGYSAVLTGLTLATLQFVLLPLTNLSLSQFELTYESVALDFLGAPKAYLLLLVGAALASRSNLLFGWDYNGILVPALLAIAWYRPAELLSTGVEAVVVAQLAQWLSRTPPLRGRLIEGPRRVVVVFVLGFALKIGLGYTALWLWPGVAIGDFYGFGYLVSALISLKIWQHGSVPRVLVPVMAICAVAFVLGNGAGYVLAQVARPTDAARRTIEVPEPLGVDHAAVELALQGADVTPAETSEQDLVRLAAFIREARRGSPDWRRGGGWQPVSAPRHSGGRWWFPRPVAARDKLPASVAVTDAARARGLVLVDAPPDSAVAVFALGLAEHIGAAALLVGEGDALLRAVAAMRATIRQTVARLRLDARRLLVELSQPDSARREAALAFVGATRDRVSLERQSMSARAARVLGPTPPPMAQRSLDALLDLSAAADRAEPLAPRGARRIWLLMRTVFPALEQQGADERMDPYVRALAGRLGLSLCWVPRQGQPDGRWAVALIDNSSLLLWLVAETSTERAVATPPATLASGRPQAALALAERLPAGHLVLGGGRQQLASTQLDIYGALTAWLLGRGVNVVEVRSAPGGTETRGADTVLTIGKLTPRGRGTPRWTARVTKALAALGLSSRWYGGAADEIAFRGSTVPLIRLARDLRAPGRAVTTFWHRRARQRHVSRARSLHLEELGVNFVDASLPEYMATRPPGPGSCRLRALEALVRRVQASRNPHSLRRLIGKGAGCRLAITKDVLFGLVYAVGHDNRQVIAWRLDGAPEGHRSGVDSRSEAHGAVLSGASQIVWRRW
jgi:hypothetical protein